MALLPQLGNLCWMNWNAHWQPLARLMWLLLWSGKRALFSYMNGIFWKVLAERQEKSILQALTYIMEPLQKLANARVLRFR